MINFSDFEKQIKIQFRDKKLLKQAFTHRSYINENPSRDFSHNERLEFLGDAVLELVTTEYLFEKYPEKPEGELTSIRAALVNSQMLAKVASENNMNDYLLLSRGEKKDIGKARQYIMANAFEALVGAIYLDQGYEPSKKFIENNLLLRAEEIVKGDLWRDAKSYFQEKAQEIAGITPIYEVLKEWGPDHSKHFVIGVFLGKELVAEGEGSSKQEAQQNAAENALKKKSWN
ncbi:MAG: ribonuclease III [Candidatus Tagabacteria bacterium RIFCSPLOWO2_01_FULL_39_11]|uniref:Ribonuclease 3 n=1 Tax=Candidatus Tagabacteria bacterium RIFCSPLOWO2_01_FULL_39_11 TaxID=1802295 RepID=A0A1G2LQ20_9BACT|nr:MAG: ribonuclease III [Candidatus Tagabacteria bacterium RIFCSPLOWO2_01_FULL_39_11]